MNNQAISKVELQKLIDTKNSFVDLSVKYSLGINTDEFAKFPSFFDKRLTENQEQISSLGNELESVQGELTETKATLSQTQADLTETTANLQAKTEELNAFTEEVNGVKDGIAHEVNSTPNIYDDIITEATLLAEYPQKVGKAISISYENGQEYGRVVEAQRWIDITTSATATEEDVAKGKTFVDDYGKIKDGTLDVEAIKEEGKKSAYDEFWDIFQDYGKRTNYNSGFGLGWTRKNFKPKYDIKPTYAYQFNQSGSYEQLAKDGQVVMKDLEKEQGISFDFSKCPNLTQLNAGLLFSELNVIDMTGTESLADYIFYSGYATGEYREKLSIRRIERLILWEKNRFSNLSFGYSAGLEYIGFEGVFATNGLNLQWSTKLDKESHIKLINTLSSTTNGLSVTLSKTAVNKAFETSSGANDGSTSQEWLNLIATKPNWTILLA